MRKVLFVITILIAISPVHLLGQSHYKVELTGFSSKKYDEFSPVRYHNGIVFCSNQEDELLITYSDRSNKGLFNIFSVFPNDQNGWNKPSVFSKNLVTPFNDGPVSFTSDGKKMVYSRNIDIDVRVKNLLDPNNNLGLYFAEVKDGKWIYTEEFKYNDLSYSISTPCFSSDGRYLYYASDMPGGFGGSDLYRSELIEGEWTAPENLGEIINTRQNDAYPFLNENGDLYFASEGHGGFGAKDIFLSRNSDSLWISPVHLKAPINSKSDDFAFITNPEFTEGYFSSNRGRTDDIYKFQTLVPQLYDCDTLRENYYCFEFWDEQYPGLDSLPVIYEWVFSDGEKTRGLKVEHCFPGAGEYTAKLNIIDNTTSNIFFTQSSMEFELTDHIQPYISGEDAGIVDAEVKFSGGKSNLPGFRIEEYIWDFGDGEFMTGEETVHVFENPGEYGVRMGVKGYQDGIEEQLLSCVIKPVVIFPDNQAYAMYFSDKDNFLFEMEGKPQSGDEVKQEFSVFDVNPDEDVFRVEVMSSDKKILLNDSIFDPLRQKYEIKEFYLERDSLYSYTVGEYDNLLASYDVYGDVVSMGYTSARVKTYVLAELPVEVIKKINLDFAALSDANFEFNQHQVSKNSYPLLNKVAEILKNNPELAMEVAAHTDNVGSFDFNLDLSRKRAEAIVNYLISQGIDKVRLVGKGYGESRPIADNSTEEGRMKNRRVEFIILNE